MISSKMITIITVTTLIIFLIIPVQSIPTHHKRWTFNSWRLHGRPHPAQTPTNPPTGSILSITYIKIFFSILNLESYSSTISTTSTINHQEHSVDVDNYDDRDSYKMLLQLLQFFQMLEYDEKNKSNGYI